MCKLAEIRRFLGINKKSKKRNNKRVGRQKNKKCNNCVYKTMAGKVYETQKNINVDTQADTSSKTEKPEVKVELEEYINEHYNNDDISMNKNHNEVNICLLSLSVCNKGGKTSTLKIGNQYYKYFYQQEPALIDLKNKLGANNLDYLIVFITKKTTTDQAIDIVLNENESPVQKLTFELSAIDLVRKIVKEGDILVKDNMNLRVIPILVDEKEKEEGNDDYSNDKVNTATAVREAFSKIKEIEKEKQYSDSQIRLHYYNNGGFRNIAVIVESIMSLLNNYSVKNDSVLGEKDSKSEIIVENNNVIYDPNEQKTKIKKVEFSVHDFVSGMNEFNNYGKIDSLKRYFENKDESDRKKSVIDEELMKALECISLGIQANNIQVFVDGLNDLKNLDEKLKEADETAENGSRLNDEYLRLFKDEIVENFDFLKYLNKGSEVDFTLGMMEWCLKKGYYQQVLTIIESLTPYLLYLKGIFTFDYTLDDIKKLDKYNAVKIKLDESAVNFVYNNMVNSKFWKTGKKPERILLSFENPDSKGCYRSEYYLTINNSIYDLVKKHWKLKDERNHSNHISLPSDDGGSSINRRKGDSISVINELGEKIEEYISALKAFLDSSDSNKSAIVVEAKETDGERVIFNPKHTGK